MRLKENTGNTLDMMLVQRAGSILGGQDLSSVCVLLLTLQKKQDEKLIANSTGMDKLYLSIVISWVLRDIVYDSAVCALYKGTW